MFSRARHPRSYESAPSFWPCVVLLSAAAVFYCAPLFVNLDALGWQDWDQFTFRYETPRVALLRDHQWPVWNPYADGGTVLLAHPHSPVLSPWYIITLLFGAPLGLRLQVLVLMAVGSIGMAACVTTHLRGSRTAGVLAGVVFMMSAHFALHITEGHLEWTALGLMPWVAFGLWPGAPPSRTRVIFSALALASAILLGAVYVPALFVIFFTMWMALSAWQHRRPLPLVTWLAALLLTGGLCAAKLLPTYAFVSDHPRVADGAQRTSAAALLKGLTLPTQASLYTLYRGTKRLGEEVDPHGPIAAEDLDHEYQEYGSYPGAIGLLLAVAGVLLTARRHWPLYAAGLLSGWIALGATAPVDLWALMRMLPWYEQFQVPSRMLAPVVFTAALAAGVGLDALASGWRWRPAVTGVLTALLYLELVVMGHTLFRQIFTIPPVVVASHDTFAQRPPPREAATLVPATMKSLLMPSLRSNSGTVHGYENLSVSGGHVRATDAPDYRGEVYFDNPFLTGARVQIEDWTMGRFRVDGTTPSAARLIVNQNFARGWTLGDGTAVTATDEGLLGASVGPGDFDVTFQYWPPGLTVGLWVSAISLLLCAVVWWRDGPQ